MSDQRNDDVQDDQRNEPHDGEETIDEPVMDGATETFEPDVDPRKGEEDPALIRDVESGKKTVNPYG